MQSDPPPFELKSHDTGDRLVVVVRGEIDLSTSSELERASLDPLRAGRHVVLDLRDVDFLDSCGVRAIVQARIAATDGGGRLTVVRGPEEVQRVLEVSGLEPELELVDNPDAIA